VRLEPQGVVGILGDLMEPDTLLPRLSPHDVVVLIAMPFQFGRMSQKKFIETRDRATRFVATTLAVGEELSCPTILTQGTSYRPGPGEVVDESRPIDRFGMTKAGEQADELIGTAMEKGSPPLIRMIPGQIYGPGGLFMEMYRRLEAGKFGIVGRGDNHVPRVHVEDCAEAFALAVEQLPTGDSFIIADDTPCTVREFTEFMAQCLGRPKPRTIPRLVARLVLGKRLFETLGMDCVVTNAKAKRQLGWTLKFPSYREGLVATVQEIEAGVSTHAERGTA
jgi:nucleoside-diphosphate-sugar epimerase